MSQHSDIILDASKFKAEAISQKTIALNDNLIKIGKAGPQWYEVRRDHHLRLASSLIVPSGWRSRIPSDACQWRNGLSQTYDTRVG